MSPFNYETDEAREAREVHNMKSVHATAPPADESNHIALPCPAGVVWVNLSDMGDGNSGGFVNLDGRRASVVRPPVLQPAAAAALEAGSSTAAAPGLHTVQLGTAAIVARFAHRASRGRRLHRAGHGRALRSL